MPSSRHTLVVAVAAAMLLATAPGVATAEDKAADEADELARTTQLCIDKEIADRLAIKRKRRGAIDRLFVKRARHEFSAIGGYYVSDLFAATYVLGGSYTYHMTEATAVELAFAATHTDAALVNTLEAGRANVLDDDFAAMRLFESTLVYTPIYGKLRLGGSILRFDIHIDAGVGVVDSPTSRGTTGVAGFGMKLFLGKAVAIRIDARDHIFRQELLDRRFLVNDLSLTTGLSLFLPLRN